MLPGIQMMVILTVYYLFNLQCGEIKDVRIAHNQLGKSKGFAYLEFTDQVSGTWTAVKRLFNVYFHVFRWMSLLQS